MLKKWLGEGRLEKCSLDLIAFYDTQIAIIANIIRFEIEAKKFDNPVNVLRIVKL